MAATNLRTIKAIGLVTFALIITINILYAFNDYGVKANDLDRLVLLQANENGVVRVKNGIQSGQFLAEDFVYNEDRLSFNMSFCLSKIGGQTLTRGYTDGGRSQQDTCIDVNGILSVKQHKLRQLCAQGNSTCY